MFTFCLFCRSSAELRLIHQSLSHTQQVVLCLSEQHQPAVGQLPSVGLLIQPVCVVTYSDVTKSSVYSFSKIFNLLYSYRHTLFLSSTFHMCTKQTIKRLFYGVPSSFCKERRALTGSFVVCISIKIDFVKYISNECRLSGAERR